MEEVDEITRTIQELEKKQREFEKETQALFDDLGVTPEQIRAYFADRQNFTSEEWSALEAERTQKAEASATPENRNLEELKKRYEERNLPPYALFCR